MANLLYGNSILVTEDVILSTHHSSCNDTTSDMSDDVSLVHRVQNDDATAFDILVNKYRTRLFSVIYNMTSNKEDAFDLTQDVFIKAFSSIKEFRQESAFSTWLVRIAYTTAINSKKRKKI